MKDSLQCDQCGKYMSGYVYGTFCSKKCVDQYDSEV